MTDAPRSPQTRSKYGNYLVNRKMPPASFESMAQAWGAVGVRLAGASVHASAPTPAAPLRPLSEVQRDCLADHLLDICARLTFIVEDIDRGSATLASIRAQLAPFTGQTKPLTAPPPRL